MFRGLFSKIKPVEKFDDAPLFGIIQQHIMEYKKHIKGHVKGIKNQDASLNVAQGDDCLELEERVEVEGRIVKLVEPEEGKDRVDSSNAVDLGVMRANVYLADIKKMYLDWVNEVTVDETSTNDQDRVPSEFSINRALALKLYNDVMPPSFDGPLDGSKKLRRYLMMALCEHLGISTDALDRAIKLREQLRAGTVVYGAIGLSAYPVPMPLPQTRYKDPVRDLLRSGMMNKNYYQMETELKSLAP